jgi:TP901 family phage tail tape measure protein
MAGRFDISAHFKADGSNFARVTAGIATAAARVERSVTGAAARAQRSLVKLSSGTDRVVAGAANAAKSAAMIGGAALAGGLAVAITRGAEFEQGIADLAAVSGAAGAELEALTKRASDLGSTTKFTGVEVTGAMNSMAKAGFATKDVLSGVSGLLSAAAADGGDLGEISTALMGTLKGMGAGTDQLQVFADMMSKAGDATSASIGSIAESMVKFGPVARQLNVSAASSFAQLSLLQDAGMDASSAGTQLAAVYSKLVAPMGTTKREIAALGLTITDAAGNMKAPEQLFTEILKATDGIQGNAGKMAAFTNLVGLESKTAMLNIAAAAKGGKLGTLTKDLESAAGYADQIAAKRMDTLFGDWKLLGGAVDGVVNSLYGLQGGAMRGLVQSATSWLRANRELIVTKLDKFIGDVTAAAREAIPIVLWFTRGLSMGFQDVTAAGRGVVRVVSAITGGTAGMFGDNSALQAFNFGRALVWLTAAIVGVSVASRLATVWTYAYRAATIAVKGVVAIAKGVQWAYVFATRAGAGAMIWNTGVTWANRAAVVARNVITGISAGLQWAYNTAVAAGTAVMGPAIAATWALVAPLAAAAAALGSLYALWLAFSDLLKQTGGWGGIGAGLDSMLSGGSFFGGVDSDLDRKAREEARQREEARKRGGAPPEAATPAAKVAAAAGGAPAATQTDVMVGNQGLFDSLLASMSGGQGVPDMKGLSGSTDEASKQLEALTASLAQFSTAIPPGGVGQLPGVPQGQAGASPATPMAIPAPQLIVSREQTTEQATVIAAAVERAIKRGMEQVNLKVEAGSANGSGASGTPKTPRAGVNVSDSGSM